MPKRIRATAPTVAGTDEAATRIPALFLHLPGHQLGDGVLERAPLHPSGPAEVMVPLRGSACGSTDLDVRELSRHQFFGNVVRQGRHHAHIMAAGLSPCGKSTLRSPFSSAAAATGTPDCPAPEGTELEVREGPFRVAHGVVMPEMLQASPAPSNASGRTSLLAWLMRRCTHRAATFPNVGNCYDTQTQTQTQTGCGPGLALGVGSIGDATIRFGSALAEVPGT